MPFGCCQCLCSFSLPLRGSLLHRNGCGIGYASKSYLKWWIIQLAIHSTVSIQIGYEWLQNHGEVYASVCFPSQSAILQIIKSGVPKYLQLYMKGGFSYIWSQLVINSPKGRHTQAHMHTDFLGKSNFKKPDARKLNFSMHRLITILKSLIALHF